LIDGLTRVKSLISEDPSQKLVQLPLNLDCMRWLYKQEEAEVLIFTGHDETEGWKQDQRDHEDRTD